eukprot:m.391117 g.391117  ORF g.391117 m.391117 type:complete len:55 (+) comp212856_c0_seq1:50-214(+)
MVECIGRESTVLACKTTPKFGLFHCQSPNFTCLCAQHETVFDILLLSHVLITSL